MAKQYEGLLNNPNVRSMLNLMCAEKTGGFNLVN